MNVSILLTIGHSNHEMATFIDLLRQHGITLVADVRSSPYSRFNSQFNRETLRDRAKVHKIDTSFSDATLSAKER